MTCTRDLEVGFMYFNVCAAIAARRTLPLPPGKIWKSFVTLFRHFSDTFTKGLDALQV